MLLLLWRLCRKKRSADDSLGDVLANGKFVGSESVKSLGFSRLVRGVGMVGEVRHAKVAVEGVGGEGGRKVLTLTHAYTPKLSQLARVCVCVCVRD
jgi:hypothetical protein